MLNNITKINQNREIGRLFEIHGNFVKAYLTYGLKDDLQFTEKHIERIGRVGQHVIIPCGFEKIVGRISKYTTEDPAFKLNKISNLPKFPSFIKIIEITLLGTITNKKDKFVFERGIKAYPSADDVIFSISKKEIELIFIGESDRDSFEIGTLVEDEDEKVNIDTEKLFQNHFAILGSTGSGKTCTLINTVQSVLKNEKYKSCHFLILDPHGEYGKAFDCDEFSNDVLHRKIGGEPQDYSKLTSKRIDLPHYFFCFGEYKVLFRPAPQVQEPCLRESIGKRRKEANNEVLNEQEDEHIVADKPLPFDIKKLYGSIYGRSNRIAKGQDSDLSKEFKGFLGSLGHRIHVASLLPELKFIFNPQFGPKEYDIFRNLLLGFDEDNKFHKVTIIDLSNIPRIQNLLVIVTNFLGRCVLDYMRNRERGKNHCLIILEEAHHYVPRMFSFTDRSSDYDYTLNTFETIAKEGRKYGVCIALSSQRPRDLSETLLSQCGTYFIHRLNNNNDKSIIQSAASEVDNSLLEKMPILTKQTCLIMGDAIKSSAEVRISSLKYEPDSASVRVSKIWQEDPQYPNDDGNEKDSENSNEIEIDE